MNGHTPNAAYFSNHRTESVGRVPDPRRAPSPGWLKFQRNPNGRPGGRLRTRASAPQKYVALGLALVRNPAGHSPVATCLSPAVLAVHMLEAEDELERARR
jgi:hypothetical protein